MRKIINHQIWISVLTGVLLFSCDRYSDYIVIPPPPGEPDKMSTADIDYMNGHWIVTRAVLKSYPKQKDLTEYFRGFQVTFDHEMAICSIYGSDSWRAYNVCENYAIVFECIQDRNAMVFEITNLNFGETDKMTAIIHKEDPGFKFLPEEWNTGNYSLTLRRGY